MQLIIIYLTLELTESESRRSVRVVQGDDNGGKQIRALLTDKGQTITLDSSTDTAKFYANIDGNLVADGYSVAFSGNYVCIPINLAWTSRAGTVNCTIQITSSHGVVHTAKFDLIVAESPAYAVPSGLGRNLYDEMDVLTGRVSTLESDVESIETDVSDVETYVNTIAAQVIAINTTVTNHTATLNAIPSDIANTVKHYSMAMFPEYEITRISTTGGTGGLTGDSPDFMISADTFNAETDGLLIWKNTNVLIPKPLYGFSNLHPGAVTIEFHVSAGYFAESDTVVFEIYKKKNNASLAGIATAILSGVTGQDDEVGTAESMEA